MNIPASPRLHANQADEVFWRVGDKSRKLPFEERLQLMCDKGSAIMRTVLPMMRR